MQKSKKVALILSIFLGTLGADRFYLGYWKLGIVKLLTFGGFFVWWLVDLYNIASGRLTPKGGWSSKKTTTKTFIVKVGMAREKIYEGFKGEVRKDDSPKLSEKFKDKPEMYARMRQKESQEAEKLWVDGVIRFGILGQELITISIDGTVQSTSWFNEIGTFSENILQKNNIGRKKFKEIKEELTSLYGEPQREESDDDDSEEWLWLNNRIKRSLQFTISDPDDYREEVNYFEGRWEKDTLELD